MAERLASPRLDTPVQYRAPLPPQAKVIHLPVLREEIKHEEEDWRHLRKPAKICPKRARLFGMIDARYYRLHPPTRIEKVIAVGAKCFAEAGRDIQELVTGKKPTSGLFVEIGHIIKPRID